MKTLPLLTAAALTVSAVATSTADAKDFSAQIDATLSQIILPPMHISKINPLILPGK